MTIHPAVTIHRVGEAPKAAEPRNLLERAARCDDRTEAITIICTALGITSRRLPEHILSWPERWARFSPCTRLGEIGEWLRSECFEVMDLVDAGPISTIGD